jgi:hypothetical protein
MILCYITLFERTSQRTVHTISKRRFQKERKRKKGNEKKCEIKLHGLKNCFKLTDFKIVIPEISCFRHFAIESLKHPETTY